MYQLQNDKIVDGASVKRGNWIIADGPMQSRGSSKRVRMVVIKNEYSG